MPMTGDFLSFGQLLKHLKLSETQLKFLVSGAGEDSMIRAFREGSEMKFRRADIEEVAGRIARGEKMVLRILNRGIKADIAARRDELAAERFVEALPVLPELMSTGETMATLGVNAEQFKVLVIKQKLHSLFEGGAILYRRAEIQELARRIVGGEIPELQLDTLSSATAQEQIGEKVYRALVNKERLWQLVADHTSPGFLRLRILAGQFGVCLHALAQIRREH